jgi:hypothetical protein
MKFNFGLNFKKPLHPIEITALVIFAIYLVFPVNTPAPLAKIMNSIVGVLIVIGVTIYLFLNTHPAVAILYIFVAYELIRRSGKVDSASFLQNTNNNEIQGAPSMSTLNASATNSDSNLYESPLIQSAENTLNNYSNETVNDPIDQIDHNYAPIGENSKVLSNEHAAELARLNPPSPYGNTLEEDVIRERDPNAASRLNTTAESSIFVPVYDKGSSGTFDIL